MISKKSSFRKSDGRLAILFIGLSVFLILLFILDLFLGSVKIPFDEIVRSLIGKGSSDVWNTIIKEFRVPKAMAALLAGSALSVSGLQMQTVFRNPLAGPYVLGISSGASLGVAIMVLGISAFGFTNASGFVTSFSLVGAAWIGALIVLMVILAVSVRVKDIMTILILGMMFGSAASALVSVLQFFSNESMLRAFVIWTMGSLGSVAGMQLWVFAIAVGVGLLLSLFSIKILNVMLLGEAYSRSVGLNTTFARVIVFFSTSLLAGSVTAFCGPIGFIGIAVPHVARMIFKTSNHTILVPGVILLGSMVMLLCDIVSQVPGFQITLPLNSVAALLGIPIVIYVVLRNRKFAGV
jgi:iron complex transport system permease protein